MLVYQLLEEVTHSYLQQLVVSRKARDTVGINTASINFTCARDNHATIHAYPRPDDPIGGNVSVGIGSTSQPH